MLKTIHVIKFLSVFYSCLVTYIFKSFIILSMFIFFKTFIENSIKN